jgi:hypothetical protein
MITTKTLKAGRSVYSLVGVAKSITGVLPLGDHSRHQQACGQQYVFVHCKNMKNKVRRIGKT